MVLGVLITSIQIYAKKKYESKYLMRISYSINFMNYKKV